MRKQLGGIGSFLALGLGLGLFHDSGAPDLSATRGHSSNETVSKQLSSNQEQLANIVSSPCGQSSCTEEDLRELIDSFSLRSIRSQTKTIATDRLAENFRELANSGNTIHPVIAIVADPVHTHLSLFFDRTVDAIQQGAQQAGWIFDRAVMPWDNQEHPESSDFRLRVLQKDFQNEKEDLPGLMIFRPIDAKSLNSSLFVFVVGETPTGGVHKHQFETAVTLASMLPRVNASKTENPLRIIGPSFSGSLYSLAQLLQSELSKRRFDRAVIRSGTVSSSDTTERFLRWLPEEVDFATFQQSDRYMLRKFLEFEKNRGYTPEHVAVLAEDETAYGNIGFAAASVSSIKKSDKCSNYSEESILRGDEASVVRLYFPRDISNLRSAYQQGFAKQLPTPSDKYQVRSTLPLNLEDTGSDDDTVQQYAHSETPLSQEAILLGIVTALRKHGIEFILLQATNPMDTLFLSRFLKKGYPASRVVTVGSDLLLRRDVEDDSLLHGVMSLSTYSLLPGSDDDTALAAGLPRDVHADHIFPGALSVGVFNATLSQLSCVKNSSERLPDECQTKKDELPLARYAEYGWPLFGGLRTDLIAPLAPVVWLTVLGRDGYWPVAILDSGKSICAGELKSALKPNHSDRSAAEQKNGVCSTADKGVQFPTEHHHSPVIWRIFYALAFCLTFVFWLLLHKSSLRASSYLMTQLAPVQSTCRAVLVSFIGCLVWIVLWLTLWPWVHWSAMDPSWVRYAIWVTLGFAFFGCVSELRRRKENFWSLVFAAVAALISVLFFHYIYASTADSTRDPFLYRCIHLTSGASPLLPFLLLVAAGLWWAWFSVSGLALVDKRRPRLPLEGDLPDDIVAGHTSAQVTRWARLSEEATKKLVDVAQPAGWDSRVFGPAILGTMVTVLALDKRHPLLTFEGRTFEWVYVILLGSAAFALFCTLFRILAVWLECRKLLGTLDRFPLRRAFAELNFGWRSIWRTSGRNMQGLFRLVSRQLETLENLKREIQDEEDETGARLVTSIQATAQKYYELNKLSASLFKDGAPAALKEPCFSDSSINLYRDLQESIARTTASTLIYLQHKWWSNEGLIVREVGLEEEEKSTPEIVAWKSEQPNPCTFLAERFVALVYLNFTRIVLLRMRTLAITAGGLYILLLLSINSYPFEPRVALHSLEILMLLFVVGIIGYVFAEVDRDSILSLVTRTKPGELGAEFWVRMAAFVALPVLSLAVSQSPALNNALFSWLEPAITALK